MNGVKLSFKNSTKTSRKTKLDWTYQPPRINGGKETLDDMSLIVGLYDNYEVTKTGNLVGLLRVSGINLDLLNDTEQEDVFKSYNSFLMSSLGDGVNDTYQFHEPTVPVNMTPYLNGLKRKYLYLKESSPEQSFKIQLLASYIDHFTKIQNAKNMTTKQHLVILKVPIKNKSMESLELAAKNLAEKLDQARRDIEESLSDYDVTVNVVNNQELLGILKDLINFKG